MSVFLMHDAAEVLTIDVAYMIGGMGFWLSQYGVQQQQQCMVLLCIFCS